MVGHIAVAGHHLEGADGRGIIEPCGQHEDLVLVGHVPAVIIGLSHGKHQVRCADLTP